MTSKFSRDRNGIFTSRAYVPGHISCIFLPYKSESQAIQGSCGVGFTVDKGLNVRLYRSANTKVKFNGKLIDIASVSFILRKLKITDVELKLESKLPLGGGFGLSGAAALGTALVLNSNFQLGYSRAEVGVLAYLAEVKSRTGLADVVGQYYGGLNLRTKKHEPFLVEKIRAKERVLYFKSYGKIETRSVLGSKSKRDRVIKAAGRALDTIKSMKRKDFKALLNISYEFALNSGLLNGRRCQSTIESIRSQGGCATMAMLGDCVISTTNFKGASKLRLSSKPGVLL